MRFYFFLFLSTIIYGWGSLSYFSNSDAAWVTQTAIALQPPSFEFWFGTDSLGRDLWSRSVQGAFITVTIAVLALFIALMMGLPLGFFSGWKSGWMDRVLMRANEIFLSLPSVILIGIVYLYFRSDSEQGLFYQILQMSFAIGVIQSFSIWRWTRSLVLAEKVKPYLELAVASGASPVRIWIWHLLPNLRGQLVAFLVLQIPSFILFETTVSFFGFGLQAPLPSWGLLLQEGWKVVAHYPHILVMPALLVFLFLFSAYQMSDQTLNRKNKTSPSWTT